VSRYDRAWRVLRLTLGLLVRVLLRPRVSGRGNVPRSGPLLIVCNHQSWWDIPLLGAVQPRTLRFMAKSELFRFPPFARFLRWGGAFPVHRGEPDRAALRTVHETMLAGGAAVIFIEGSRRVNLEQAKAGAGRCAVVEDAPVVIAALHTRDWRSGRRVSIAFGPPAVYERGGRRAGDAARETADELLERIRRLYGDLP
jgi:1-acyl-sn-glycerol-3-phosphate acyltransferase